MVASQNGPIKKKTYMSRKNNSKQVTIVYVPNSRPAVWILWIHTHCLPDRNPDTKHCLKVDGNEKLGGSKRRQ